jgi:hypothetical protein
MSFAKKLEQLARVVPGVSGYQDKEAARDTDKNLRLRLAAGLEGIKRDLEEEKRHYLSQKNLPPLAELDRLSAKLDKLENLLKYAPRGYRGFFDTNKHDLEALGQLYTFDLGLVHKIKTLQGVFRKVRESRKLPDRLEEAIGLLHEGLDQFEKEFSKRQDILIKK